MPDNGKHGPGPEIPRGAPKGERSRRWECRTPRRRSSLVARFAQIDRTPGLPCGAQGTQGGRCPAADRERRLHAGHGMPIWVRRKHPSATGAPHAPREGRVKWKEGERRGECEQRETSFVGWAIRGVYAPSSTRLWARASRRSASKTRVNALVVPPIFGAVSCAGCRCARRAV